jgi:hypothetical protein
MACDDLCLCLFKCSLVRGGFGFVGGGAAARAQDTDRSPPPLPTAFRSGIEEHCKVELHYRSNRRHLIIDHSLNGTYAFMDWQGEQIHYE